VKREAIHQEVKRLMADVEELIRRVGNATDPEVARLRAKVEGALDTTKAALSENTEQLQRQARNAFAAGDRYVHDQAWQVIGVAAGVAPHSQPRRPGVSERSRRRYCTNPLRTA
jgi:ElaB/YqjD/DUF883 family membrane-anchored ribosome-binding protein